MSYICCLELINISNGFKPQNLIWTKPINFSCVSHLSLPYSPNCAMILSSFHKQELPITFFNFKLLCYRENYNYSANFLSTDKHAISYSDKSGLFWEAILSGSLCLLFLLHMFFCWRWLEEAFFSWLLCYLLDALSKNSSQLFVLIERHRFQVKPGTFG